MDLISTSMIPKPHIKSTPRPSDPIGVFDSGIGGLSVLRELQRLMPRERFVFFADQKHVPYGAKTAAQLKRYTGNIARFLLARRCKIIVVACNTGTVYAIGHLRRSFPVPFIGTVPAIKPAALMSKTGVVGIMSTPATAVSPALRLLVRTHTNGMRVIRVGCPGLRICGIRNRKRSDRHRGYSPSPQPLITARPMSSCLVVHTIRFSFALSGDFPEHRQLIPAELLHGALVQCSPMPASFARGASVILYI